MRHSQPLSVTASNVSPFTVATATPLPYAVEVVAEPEAIFTFG